MLLTRKSSAGVVPQSRLARSLSGTLARTMDRRAFLKRSGVAAGAGAFASQLPFNLIGKAEAQEKQIAEGKVEVKRTVCTHCSVGCAIDAVVENGVWVRQEPVFDSPINLGSHCAKGASVREHGVTEHSHRLKYPMKLVNGKYQRLTWDQALDEISKKMLKIREESGPDALFIVGSSKHSNEQSELLCKWVRLWGSNNTDHQARICHSTTVAGVANTWGYGAMTNSYNDEQNSKCILFFGSNAAEAHPVSMLHTLHAKELGAKVIVVDPRFTRTAAKADMYFRSRSGSDVAFLWGMLYHIFKNGWEDKEYINARVYGMEKVKEEVMKWTPDVVRTSPACRSRMSAPWPKRWQRIAPARSCGRWARRSTRTGMPSSVRAASSSSPSATSAWRAAAPTSIAATTTCRARPTSGRTPIHCRATTASRRARSSTGVGSGTSTSSGSKAATRRE